MTITFRCAGPDDDALLHHIGLTSYLHHFAHLWVCPDELAAFVEQEFSLDVIRHSLQSPGCQWIIAHTTRPVEFAKVSWHEAMPHMSPQGAFLNKIYLLPKMTGQGLGTELFHEVIRLAKDHGETALWLEVLEANQSARRFYERHGMHVMKQHVFRSPHQESTLFLMAGSI